MGILVRDHFNRGFEIPGNLLFLSSERKRCNLFSKLIREECNIIMLYAPFNNKHLNFTEGHRIDSVKVSETFLTVINKVSLLTACFYV